MASGDRMEDEKNEGMMETITQKFLCGIVPGSRVDKNRWMLGCHMVPSGWVRERLKEVKVEREREREIDEEGIVEREVDGYPNNGSNTFSLNKTQQQYRK